MVRIIEAIIPESSAVRPAAKVSQKKYIVIHNTGNYAPASTALAHHNYLKSLENEPARQVSWHYTVDSEEIYHHVPDDENAWHASDGSFGDGNFYGIGIEICVNGFPNTYEGDEYDRWLVQFKKTLDNAAWLVAKLMREHGIPPENIKQHYDFARDKKNCPMQMRYDSKSKSYIHDGDMWCYFMDKVKNFSAKKKLFISADIEGSCGIVSWDETDVGNAYSDYFRKQMTREVSAVCRAAFDAGFDEVVIKDAHDSARNIYPDELPRGVKLIRSWSKDPFCMMSGLDDSFTAVAFTGYHNAAGTGSNPLSHTMTTDIVSYKINGVPASEYMINSYIAAYFGVPVVFLSGDKGLCGAATDINQNIATVAVSEGRGNCSLALQPEDACELIEKTANAAFVRLLSDKVDCKVSLPEKFDVEIGYRRPFMAYKASFYPGARLIDDSTVGFSCTDFMDFLRFELFAE